MNMNMNIVIYALGSYGDVHPYIGLGSMLTKENNITFVTNPSFSEMMYI